MEALSPSMGLGPRLGPQAHGGGFTEPNLWARAGWLLARSCRWRGGLVNCTLCRVALSSGLSFRQVCRQLENIRQVLETVSRALGCFSLLAWVGSASSLFCVVFCKRLDKQLHVVQHIWSHPLFRSIPHFAPTPLRFSNVWLCVSTLA